MNQNKLTGVWQKTKGKIKEEIGHAIGNTRMEAEGVADQVKGTVNEKIGGVKDAIKNTVDAALGTKESK